MRNKKTIIIIIGILVLSIAFIGVIIKHKDVLVKEDTEYLYYKEYKWFNLDSNVYKYHKPIIRQGKVIDKYTRSHFRAIPGKTVHQIQWRHPIIIYYVVFKFNNQIETENRGKSFYDYFNKGDSVKIIEIFYPQHELIYKNLK